MEKENPSLLRFTKKITSDVLVERAVKKLEDKYGDRQEGLFEGQEQAQGKTDTGRDIKSGAEIPAEKPTGETEAKPVEAFGKKIGETIPVFVVAENGILIKSSRKDYIDTKQRSLFDEGIPDSKLRPDNIPSGDEVLRGRGIPDDRGIVLSATYKPEHGTIPEVKSRPIGTWKSSRSKITHPKMPLWEYRKTTLVYIQPTCL